jgi:hypothetical protein
MESIKSDGTSRKKMEIDDATLKVTLINDSKKEVIGGNLIGKSL